MFEIEKQSQWETVINNIVIGVILVTILFVVGQCSNESDNNFRRHRLQEKQLNMINDLNNPLEKKEALIKFLSKDAKKD